MLLRTFNTLLAILACGMTALALLPALGHQAMVVTSGSMAPTINAGDVVVLSDPPADRIRQGDVITFQGYGTGTLTTHRVVGVRWLPSGLHYQTKGDGNDAADPNLAPFDGLRGRVAITLPELGRAALLLQDRWVRLVLLGGPSLLWAIQSMRHIMARPSPAPSTPRSGRRRIITGRLAALALLAGTATGGAAVVLHRTSATYADVVPVGANTFSTAATLSQ